MIKKEKAERECTQLGKQGRKYYVSKKMSSFKLTVKQRSLPEHLPLFDNWQLQTKLHHKLQKIMQLTERKEDGKIYIASLLFVKKVSVPIHHQFFITCFGEEGKRRKLHTSP